MKPISCRYMTKYRKICSNADSRMWTKDVVRRQCNWSKWELEFKMGTHYASICPLYKNGDQSCASNHHSVSLTYFLCKLLEHTFCSNIMAQLEQLNLLSDRQYASRKRHSCETQLMTVINNWAKSWTEVNKLTFILDFQKAFDNSSWASEM